MPPYVFMFLCAHEDFGATFVQIHNLVVVSSKFLIMWSKCVRCVEFARAASVGAWAHGEGGASAELPRATRSRPNSGRISRPHSGRYLNFFSFQKFGLRQPKMSRGKKGEKEKGKRLRKQCWLQKFKITQQPPYPCALSLLCSLSLTVQPWIFPPHSLPPPSHLLFHDNLPQLDFLKKNGAGHRLKICGKHKYTFDLLVILLADSILHWLQSRVGPLDLLIICLPRFHFRYTYFWNRTSEMSDLGSDASKRPPIWDRTSKKKRHFKQRSDLRSKTSQKRDVRFEIRCL